MRKCFLFLVISILITFLNTCTVNEYTGLINITNSTAKTITNIKLGKAVLTYSLKPGKSWEYWICSPLSGYLYADNVEIAEIKEYTDGILSDIVRNPLLTYKCNYRYELDIYTYDDKNYFDVTEGKSPGNDTHHPAE